MEMDSLTPPRTLELELPWPPSVNHYWRHVTIGRHVRTLISAKGRLYKREVGVSVLAHAANTKTRHIEFMGRLEVSLELYPPDRRNRDIDNSTKAVLDALTDAHVWRDDSQVDELHIKRMGIIKGGKAIIRITEIN